MLRPLGNNVILEVKEQEQKTASGIILTDSAKEKSNEGVVAAVGPGRLLDNGVRAEMQIKVGDKIIYSPFGGSEVKVGEAKYLVLSEDDVLAIVE